MQHHLFGRTILQRRDANENHLIAARGLSGGCGGRGEIESFLYKTDVYSPEEFYKVVILQTSEGKTCVCIWKV